MGRQICVQIPGTERPRTRSWDNRCCSEAKIDLFFVRQLWVYVRGEGTFTEDKGRQEEQKLKWAINFSFTWQFWNAWEWTCMNWGFSYVTCFEEAPEPESLSLIWRAQLIPSNDHQCFQGCFLVRVRSFPTRENLQGDKWADSPKRER